jgi:diguanylate cyclase (GGDEF)-like protein
MFTPSPIDGLSVLAEMDAEEAFVELGKLKTQVSWIFALVLLVMLGAVYVFGASLVRPLDGLINGARRVAEGDLDVDLPTDRRDEIGYLSQVFNDMVVHLQESRQVVTAAQSQLVEHNRRLEELTVTDTLTGLANRRRLSEQMALQLERYRRNGRPFSVLMLDLDHFKTVNDRYGHLVGDQVLRQFAVCLTQSIRAVDFVARYGGEEFTILLFETGQADSWELAERIRTGVQEMRLTVESATVLRVTVSIGIAEVRNTDIAPDDLLQRADAALYQAKRAGRNCVCFAGNSLADAGVSIGHGQ